MKAVKVAIALLASVLGTKDIAHAHPHAWIDFEAKIQVNDAGMLTGIHVNWLFDDFYTAFVADEIVKSGSDPREGLFEIGRTNLVGLREYDYYADLRADGTKLDILDVEYFETGVEDGRIWLRFELVLASAIDPDDQRFTYRFYDPTYYIEVLHAEGHEPVIEGRDDCVITIDPPNPSPDIVALAFSFDQTDQAPEALGASFAETAALICG